MFFFFTFSVSLYIYVTNKKKVLLHLKIYQITLNFKLSDQIKLSIKLVNIILNTCGPK